jgi:hypothetical protein
LNIKLRNTVFFITIILYLLGIILVIIFKNIYTITFCIISAIVFAGFEIYIEAIDNNEFEKEIKKKIGGK